MHPLVIAIITEHLLLNLSLLHIRRMNDVFSWYVLALQCLFHFTACVSSLFISLYFLVFVAVVFVVVVVAVVECTICRGTEVTLSILLIKQGSCSEFPK